MSGLNDILGQVSTEKEADKILQGMSDSDILGGDFTGEDLRKKVRNLIKEYHPDKHNHQLVGDVRTAIIKRLGNVSANKNGSLKGSTGNPADKTDKKNSQEKNKTEKESDHPKYRFFERILENIHNTFQNSDKSNLDFLFALNDVSLVERTYCVNLKETKNKIIKIRVQQIYDTFKKSLRGVNDYNLALGHLRKIENKYSVNLNKTKKQIMRMVN